MKSLNSYIIENIIPVDESVKELYDVFVDAVGFGGVNSVVDSESCVDGLKVF